MQPLGLLTDAVLTRCYTLNDRLLCVRAQDEWSARLADRYINEFYFIPAPPTLASKADCTLSIMTCEPLPHVPCHLPKLEVTRGYCRPNGESLYLEIDDSVIHIGPKPSGSVDVWIGETMLARHPVAIANVLSYSVQAMLRRCNLFALHAAGVVEPQSDAGALIIGDSNSGKTTLTLRLASSGWRYLTDDLVVLQEISSGVNAAGHRRVFAVTEET